MPESSERIDPALPASVAACVDRVGVDAVWLAGGPVRDALLQRLRPGSEIGAADPDFDFATTVRPADVVARLGAVAVPRADDLELGAVEARCGEDWTVTFTTLRRDGPYPVHARRPASVEFVDDLGVDATRRDFTINALYARVADGAVFDPLESGIPDLGAGLLRVVGDPRVRLFEDPLRVLRAVRFASRFDLQIDTATSDALAGSARRITAVVPPARCFDELDRALRAGPVGARALELVRRFRIELAAAPVELATSVLPFEPLAMLSPSADSTLRWSATLLGCGAVDAALLSALQAPRELVRSVSAVLAQADATRRLGALSAAAQRSCARAPEFERGVELVRALDDGFPGFVPNREAFEGAVARVDTTRLVTGRDVLGMGVEPGVAVGRVLAEVERRLTHDSDRASALGILREVVAAEAVKPPPHGRR